MRIFLVIIIIAGVALQIRVFVNAKVDLDTTEPALLVQILGNSPEFLEGQNMVSVERFRNANLDNVFEYKERHASAKLTLLDSANNKISETYLNRNYYDELAAQVARFKGKTVVQLKRQWPVTLVDQDKISQGTLRVEVLQPR